MKLRFFTVPVHNPGPVAAELDTFLSNHRVAQIDRQFVSDGGNSAWAICVTFIDSTTRAESEKRGTTDYREVLPEAQFRMFARLRTVRKELADKEGVPAYAIFTNEQLAEMVRQSVATLAALKKIHGVGAARAEKYGAAFLAILAEQSVLPATSPGPTNGNAVLGQPG